MTMLFVAWQDPKHRNWHPVGRLHSEGNDFVFRYTKGAMETSRFVPFGRMRDIHAVYRSRDLFPLFKNRLPPKSRPEYYEYIDWLGLDEGEQNPLDMLARNGGARATDSLVVFPCPTPDQEGRFSLTFFSHGIRYLDPKTIAKIDSLTVGTLLYPLLDNLNPHDQKAIALRTEAPAQLVGYIPRYHANDVRTILNSVSPEQFKLTVEKVNPNAPIQFRLLCTLVSSWPNDFSPCADDAFQPIDGPAGVSSTAMVAS